MTRQLMFLVRPEDVDRVARLESRAERGDGSAACELGDGHSEGGDLPFRPRRAFRWYLRGAFIGNVAAMNNLGVCYGAGDGCRSDVKQAAHWYRRAAERDLSVAQFNLGRCYLDGKGVRKNRRTAVQWLRKAAAQGYANASQLLEEIGESVGPDDKGSSPRKESGTRK